MTCKQGWTSPPDNQGQHHTIPKVLLSPNNQRLKWLWYYLKVSRVNRPVSSKESIKKEFGFKLNQLFHHNSSKAAINHTRRWLRLSGLSSHRRNYAPLFPCEVNIPWGHRPREIFTSKGNNSVESLTHTLIIVFIIFGNVFFCKLHTGNS
jgi:hypothetical protein